MDQERTDRLKSWILFMFGLVGMAYQQWSDNISAVLLFIYTMMIGVPGFINLIALLKTSPTATEIPGDICG